MNEALRRIQHDPGVSTSALTPIPWPSGLAPTPQLPSTDVQAPLPPADVLVVTWTTAESHALADVLTPGQKTTQWTSYKHNWRSRFRGMVQKGAPALEEDATLIYSTSTIGALRVVVAKSQLHMSQDGAQLPIVPAWKQWIRETGAGLVITTGTAGGIGIETLLGDVTIAAKVSFDCTELFKGLVGSYAPAVPTAVAATAPLIAANAAALPESPRQSDVTTGGDVLTTDFFAFDDASDHYGLRSFDADATMVEMGDAALGLAVSQLADAPRWMSIRNASDPQMTSSPFNLEAEDKEAASIYDKYGYWTSVNSAIACWAVIAGTL